MSCIGHCAANKPESRPESWAIHFFCDSLLNKDVFTQILDSSDLESFDLNRLPPTLLPEEFFVEGLFNNSNLVSTYSVTFVSRQELGAKKLLEYKDDLGKEVYQRYTAYNLDFRKKKNNKDFKLDQICSGILSLSNKDHIPQGLETPVLLEVGHHLESKDSYRVELRFTIIQNDLTIEFFFDFDKNGKILSWHTV
ncbi:MAG: hypothetical protein Roseis2KO_21070 [Roseivirga sp.]